MEIRARPVLSTTQTSQPAASALIFSLMRPEKLLCPTPAGLYCPPGDFHIDPTRAVPRALITHGHSDHARSGHGHVMATPETLAVMAARYGGDFAGATQDAVMGETVDVSGVSVSFHPAGHVLGSAQIAVEKDGFRIVASGDYKRERDPTCADFELVKCDVFISEATFGLPVFRHPPAHVEIAKLLDWLASSRTAPTSSAPIRSARPSASSGFCARPDGTGPSSSTARSRRSAPYTGRPASSSVPCSRFERPKAGLPARSSSVRPVP